MDIINVLESRYDRVNNMQLHESKTALKAFIYNLMETIDEEIFQKIKDYAEVAEMMNTPKSECQKIDVTMFIVIKLRRFQVKIRVWYLKPVANKTWDNFKDAFRESYNSLRDLGDLTIEQSPVLNQAQLLEQIMQAIMM